MNETKLSGNEIDGERLQMDSFFSFVIMAAGVYVLYAALNLKRQRVLNKSVLRSPGLGTDPKDLDGFIAYMYPRCLALGIITIVMGGWNLLSAYIQVLSNPTVYMICELGSGILFFAYLIYYMRCVKTAEHKFY